MSEINCPFLKYCNKNDKKWCLNIIILKESHCTCKIMFDIINIANKILLKGSE